MAGLVRFLNPIQTSWVAAGGLLFLAERLTCSP